MSQELKVKVFSTINCGVCHAEMKWLDGQGVKYSKAIVDEDPDAMTEFMQVNEGMIGTPFTVVRNGDEVTKIAGFDQKRLKVALNLS